MKKNDAPPTMAATSVEGDTVAKLAAKKHARDRPLTANDLGEGIDRPGFDLGGSSGETHAGTGLSFGKDAFDMPVDARLPGRRLNNNLAIPRRTGSGQHSPALSGEKAGQADTPSPPENKKSR